MKKADFVFELSYEVCNKVGGIYAVIASKAAQMVDKYGEGYYAVGFYNPQKARVGFDEQEPSSEIKSVFDKLKPEGIECRYGKWLIPGRPHTILIDPNSYMGEADNIKRMLWECCRVDSLRSDHSFTEPVVWSMASGKLLEELIEVVPFKGKRCVAQFHEWLSGAGMLYAIHRNLDLGTVFTTHATMLGRTLSGSGLDLYKMIDGVTPTDSITNLANRYGVIDKHSMEVACATKADVFTTVSTITAKEAKYLLGRESDLILPNGLDMDKFPEIEELTVMRRKYRRQMRDFLTAYFCRYYFMDFYNIRSMFLSGRYEFHNKGIDLFIEALGRLNKRMRENKLAKNAVVFLFVLAATRGENVEVLKNTSLYEEMRDHVDEILPDIKDNVLSSLIRGEMPDDVLSDEMRDVFRTLMIHFTEKRGGTPPLCAFDLVYPDDDILRHLVRNGLLNREEDKVKVIYYPAYLSAADRLIPLDYNQATITCDVGVFPSYYEPWGYTPLEIAAQGSLAITTDFAGYGRFIEGKGKGIYVLKREGREWNEIVEDLAKKLYDIVTLSKREIMEYRLSAKEISYYADWKLLVENYVSAHNLALDKLDQRM